MLNSGQQAAINALNQSGNLFLSGAAGTGKTFVINSFLQDQDSKKFPALATTGAAAILLGGRTFHSFFGLGILEGGVEATVARALERKGLMWRLRKVRGVLIDEVSMLSADALEAAERIARGARGNDEPWGGMRVVVVGDFFQLPPVSRSVEKPWAFRSEAWERSQFRSVVLTDVVRTEEDHFLQVLSHIRAGELNSKVKEFLRSRQQDQPEANTTRLYPTRERVERFNEERLLQLSGTEKRYGTEYWVDSDDPRRRAMLEQEIRRSAPVPEVLRLKEGALVLFRMNDLEGRWVNGSLGVVKGFNGMGVDVELLSGGTYNVGPTSFDWLDAEGKRVATAKNFPLNLAYATTIHKAQGMTLDRLWVDLSGAWEHGQAYVALSRVRRAADLSLGGLSAGAFKVDPQVVGFYRELKSL